MKTISTKAPYEPLEIEIGNQVVKTAIDVSVDGLLALAAKCKKAAQKMKALESLHDKARKGKHAEALKRLNAELAKVMEGPIKQAIGEDDYEAVVKACGMGREIAKEDCNPVFAMVFRVINETVKERNEDALALNDALNEKAAHYLAEVRDAQPEPDTDN